jgi:hypothetical protein
MNRSFESLLHLSGEFTKPSLALVVDLILEFHDSTFLHQQNLTHGVTSRIDLQRPSENRIISLQSTDYFIFIRHAALMIFHSMEVVLVYLRLFSST